MVERWIGGGVVNGGACSREAGGTVGGQKVGRHYHHGGRWHPLSAGPLIRTLPHPRATPISNYATHILLHPRQPDHMTPRSQKFPAPCTPITPYTYYRHHDIGTPTTPSLTNPRPAYQFKARFKIFRHYDFQHLTLAQSQLPIEDDPLRRQPRYLL